MKKLMFAALSMGAIAITDAASADPVRAGMDVDLGVASGLGVGGVVEPGLKWLRLGASFQENYVAPGLKGSVVLSPIKFPVFPELQLDMGGFFRETLPFAVDGYHFNAAYTYQDIMLNVGFGNRDSAFFFVSGGIQHLDASLGGLPQDNHITNSLFQNPSYHGWLPAGRLGFAIYFN